VHRLKVELMTAESFRPFGEVWEPGARPSDRPEFFSMSFEIDGKTTVSVIWQPYQGKTFTELERHFKVTQSFVPLEGSPSVVAVAAPTDPDDPNDVPKPEDVHAFLIDGTRGYGYKTGTWHSLNRYVLHPPGASFIILNVEPNPTQVVDYEERFGVSFAIEF
jgi:ureidoglycolate lyase